MSFRPMLIVSKLGDAARSALVAAGSDAGLALEVVASAGEAVRRLSAQPGFDVIVVDMHADGAQRFLSRCRKERELQGVPVIMLSRLISDLTFAKAYRWGADDVVLRRGVPELIARLETVPRPRPPSTRHPRGVAVVADPDAARCDIVGRVLAHAGYEVLYGVDERSVDYYLEQPSVRLVVLSTEFGDFEQRYLRARADNGQAVWIISAKQRDLRRVMGICARHDRMVAVGSLSPPDNVLFLANDLSSDSTEQRQRTSERLLFGTAVTFRVPGTSHDDYGFSYNVSTGGLFVRTLALPETDRLWIDVRPPHEQQMVRLLGEIRWTRPYGHSEFATAPPGFGVRLVEGLGDDLFRWVEAVQRLGEAVAAGEPSYSDPPPSSELEGPARIASLIDEHVAAGRGTLSSLSGEVLTGDEATAPHEARRPSDPTVEVTEDGAGESAAGAGAPAPVAKEEPPADARASDRPSPASDALSEDSVSGAVRSLEAAGASPAPKRPRRLGPLGLAAAVLATGGAVGLFALRGGQSAGPPEAPAVDDRGAAGREAVVPREQAPPPSGAAATVRAEEPVAPAEGDGEQRDDRPADTDRGPPGDDPETRDDLPGSEQGGANDPDDDDSPSAEELAALPPSDGLLFVASPVEANVSVHGIHAGRTNEWLRVRCGPRFIRLGDPGSWLTRGQSEVVACRGATRIIAEPDQ